MILALKVLFGFCLGWLGAKAFERMEGIHGGLGLIWILGCACSGLIAGAAIGFAISWIGDPIVSTAIGTMLGGFMGGFGLAALAYRAQPT